MSSNAAPSPPVHVAGRGIEADDLAVALGRRGISILRSELPGDGADELDTVLVATPRANEPPSPSALEPWLARLARGEGRAVLVSTVLVYGECGTTTRSEDGPFFPTPNTRWCLDLEGRVLAAGGCVVRVGLVHGGGGGELARRIDVARRDGVARWIGHGTAEIPTVHVADLADLCLRALRRAAPGTAFAAAVGSVVRRDLASAVAVVADVPAGRWPVYQAVAVGGLDELEDVTSVRVKAERARDQLGWEPGPSDVVAELLERSRPPAPVSS